MSRRIYPYNKVKYWNVYDVDGICALYADYKLHPQTVRKWTKNGLKTIDDGKPTLIYGNDLITFFKKNNTKNKCGTAFDEMFCMKCQQACPIYQNKVMLEQKNKFLKAKAHCRTCKTVMNKNYKMTGYPQLKKAFKLVDVLELYDCEHATDKTHIETQPTMPLNESSQASLF